MIIGVGVGIGCLMVEKLVVRGVEVIVIVWCIVVVREVVECICNVGGNVYVYILDVSKIIIIVCFCDILYEECGLISMLINNVGVVFGGEFE